MVHPGRDTNDDTYRHFRQQTIDGKLKAICVYCNQNKGAYEQKKRLRAHAIKCQTARRDMETGMLDQQATPLAWEVLTSNTSTFPSAEVDETQVDVDWNTFELSQMETTSLPHLHESNAHVVSRGCFFDSHHIPDDSHNDEDLLNADPEFLPLTKLHYSAFTLRAPYVTVFSKLNPLDRAESEYLAHLPNSDPTTHFTITLVAQMLRAFPEGMTRRETLPSFIHGHWSRACSATEPALPGPLVNCMGIAQIFVTQNPEITSFLWHTIKAEQRSLMEKVRTHICVVGSHRVFSRS